MQLIQEKYRSIGRDINIKIPLGANANLNGLQQSIDEYIERETGLSINEVEDGETFRYKANRGRTFEFDFFNGSTYGTSLLNAGFTSDEIDNLEDVVTNSFYIMQVYDSTVRENQTLLHNSYLNGTTFESASSVYDLEVEDEFMNLYIPEWFINSDDSSVLTIYFTFLFFNAKTGKLQVFYNELNETDTTEDKMYFEGLIFKNSSTYGISVGGNLAPVLQKELPNADYVERINESLSSFENQLPRFPDGNFFEQDGDYGDVT